MILMELMHLTTDDKADREHRHDWQDRRIGARRLRARQRQERRTEKPWQEPPGPRRC